MKRKNHFYQLNSISTLSILLLLFICNILFAQDNTECPYFSVFVEDTSTVEFALKATNIKATISGVIANVEMEQVYENSGEAGLDATYVFPMSTRAAVYSMQMIVDDRVIDAEIKEKAEAQEIFEEANENGQTATLLDQQRPNVFQMSLANIEAGSTLKVKMNYTELIEPEKGIYQFVVPTIVGPRFTTGGEEWIAQTKNDSLAVSETALNIDLKINAGMNVSATSTSHNVEFTKEDETVFCQLKTNPEKDFIVDYTLNDNKIETGLLLYEGGKENFFLTMIQPPKPEVNFRSPKREYVFVIDVSGSMRGEPIEISKGLITDLLYDLNSDDKFNILFFSGGSSVFSENSLPVTPENINEAIKMIDNINAGGGTYLLPAMQQALNMGGTEDYSRTFVILTDGNVSVEKETYELIRQNLNEANFFAFGIGQSVNRYIIEGIAYVGQGEAFVATNNEIANEVATTFKEYIERPALTNIKADFSGVNVYDVEPISIPDLFAERPIIIYGKYDNANNGSVTVSGDFASGNISSTLNFADYKKNVEENIAIKYLWARKRIQLMADYGIADNVNDTLSIEEEITQLGLDYSLVTDYTSFVAVDSLAVTDVAEETANPYNYYDNIFSYPISLVGLDEIKHEDINIIEIIGSNINKNEIVNIKLKDIIASPFDKIVLSIVDINGVTLLSKELSVAEFENIISLDITGFANQCYFINLSSNNKIIDTERFILLK